MTPHLTTIHDPQTAHELAATHPAQAALAGRNGAPKGETCGTCCHFCPKGNGKLGQRARCGLADRMHVAVGRTPYRGSYPLPPKQPACRFWEAWS
jgi:hypothetical protein